MKSLSLFVSAAALLSASSVFAIDCGTLPTCESLGYNDIVSQCPKSSVGEDLAVKCPFDTTKGKCINEAAVGEIAYFSKAPNTNSGWLLCNGQTITEAKYPDLYKFLGQQFCTNDHGGTCGSGVARLPDYRGYFLRVYAKSSSSDDISSTFSTYGGSVNTKIESPQKEELPDASFSQNIGYTGVGGKGYPDGSGDSTTVGHENSYPRKSQEINVSFNLKNLNSIYKTGGHVTPPNYSVYAYIYAGKTIK